MRYDVAIKRNSSSYDRIVGQGQNKTDEQYDVVFAHFQKYPVIAGQISNSLAHLSMISVVCCDNDLSESSSKLLLALEQGPVSFDANKDRRTYVLLCFRLIVIIDTMSG